jgi:hypothetical protein
MSHNHVIATLSLSHNLIIATRRTREKFVAFCLALALDSSTDLLVVLLSSIPSTSSLLLTIRSVLLFFVHHGKHSSRRIRRDFSRRRRERGTASRTGSASRSSPRREPGFRFPVAAVCSGARRSTREFIADPSPALARRNGYTSSLADKATSILDAVRLAQPVNSPSVSLDKLTTSPRS